jgi:[ribosomal protein S5]-alanine N-acetyltransferase
MSISMELKEIPKIETERLILRMLREEDATDIFHYTQKPEVTKFLIWHPHNTIQDTLDFIQFAEKQFDQGISIILGIELKSENKIIGTIDLRDWKNPNRCGDIGYVIAPDYWRKGIMTEALHAVLKFGFEELELNRLEAHCEEENVGSWRVMEKCGMKHEGILREKVYIKKRFRSMKMYSILRKEWL